MVDTNNIRATPKRNKRMIQIVNIMSNREINHMKEIMGWSYTGYEISKMWVEETIWEQLEKDDAKRKKDPSFFGIGHYAELYGVSW